VDAPIKKGKGKDLGKNSYKIKPSDPENFKNSSEENPPAKE